MVVEISVPKIYIQLMPNLIRVICVLECTWVYVCVNVCMRACVMSACCNGALRKLPYPVRLVGRPADSNNIR